MPECNPQQLSFSRSKGRAVEASFSGGELTSNGGVLRLRQTGRRLGTGRADGEGALRSAPQG